MKAGHVIGGRYVIQSLIGKGGMQDVYLAKDDLLGSLVALKTPQEGQHRKRFNQSAKIAARINHHNVAKTLDYLEEEGRQFLIEEYVEGETLEAKLARFGVVDPHLGTRVLHHLAKGIAASHHAGVIHRDMKPSNVMVEKGINIHHLKVTDFGIASLTEEVFEEALKDGDITRTTSGTIRGALPYMAPEMMFRRPGEYPGPEMDVWSMGAMMFRLLTGIYPFGVLFHAAANVKMRNREPWPSFMTQNPQYRPLAEELQRLIDQCLQYEPDKRPKADQIVHEVSDFCYINVDRDQGNVTNLIQGGQSGFADDDQGQVFFSMQSVYGERRPDTRDNCSICYSKFPGSPRPRAHPVIVVDASD